MRLLAVRSRLFQVTGSRPKSALANDGNIIWAGADELNQLLTS